MSILANSAEEELSRLLAGTVAELDITPEDYRAAERRYNDVGEHLQEHRAHIYVQGSVLLGTVVAPWGRRGEYDLDLVCRWDVAKTSVTKSLLKARVGGFLAGYIESGDCVDGEVPDLGEGRRSWKLGYDRFHMDVLPAIPDVASASATAIELTDKQLHEWQHSDPLAYAAWFRQCCARQLELERKALAEASGTLDPVPMWQIRTPLHRVVQVLKRHRDVKFATDPDDRPPSSLITTLAGLGYRGETDLIHATLCVVQRMPTFIEVRDGIHWVGNPACPEENFADKWSDYPLRRQKFLRWQASVECDLEAMLRERAGAPAVHARLGEAFGADVVNKALSAIGGTARALRESGSLRFGAGGVLTTAATAGPALARHEFFGA